MGRTDKLVRKAEANPQGLSFMEFEGLLRGCGWLQVRQRGSHRLWRSPQGKRLPVQPAGGKAKAYQVRQFLAILKEEGDE